MVLVLPGAYSYYRWEAIKGEPLDAFFKNELSDKTPSCPGANEYLAEDVVMSMKLYTKPGKGWLVQYVPDAPAKTDAPDSFVYLMKQRRRWMNGNLFGKLRIIRNFFQMVSCTRNDHPVIQQLGQLYHMIFFTLLYLLSFSICGTSFACVIVFVRYFVRYFLRLHNP